MDNLWAPWRIAYVSAADKEEGGCFLCRAVGSDDDRRSLVVWRAESCFCLLNRWPYNNGHLMVAPAQHRADVSDLSDAELLDQVCMVRRCRELLGDVLHPDGFNVGMNLGAAAGAGLATHLHWHIVPRWHGDTNCMPVIAHTKVIPQALDELWLQLREAAQRSSPPEPRAC